jgi:hypothetical protein
MSSRHTAIHVITKTAVFLSALFLVGVLLAAIPAHKSPSIQNSALQESQSTPPHAHDMSVMDTDDHATDEHSAAAGAIHDMTPGGHDPHSLHMYMTAPRPQTPEDAQRANEIVTQLRSASKNIATITSRSTTASRFSCPIFPSLNITSPK